MFLLDKASANIIQKLPIRRSWPLFSRNCFAKTRDPCKPWKEEKPRHLLSLQSMSLKFAALFILIQRNWSNDITGRGAPSKVTPILQQKLPSSGRRGVGGELLLTKQPHSSFKEALNLLFLHNYSQKFYLLRLQENLCNLSWVSSERHCLL